MKLLVEVEVRIIRPAKKVHGALFVYGLLFLVKGFIPREQLWQVVARQAKQVIFVKFFGFRHIEVGDQYIPTY